MPPWPSSASIRYASARRSCTADDCVLMSMHRTCAANGRSDCKATGLGAAEELSSRQLTLSGQLNADQSQQLCGAATPTQIALRTDSLALHAEPPHRFRVTAGERGGTGRP